MSQIVFLFQIEELKDKRTMKELLSTFFHWFKEVNEAFDELEEGNEDALKTEYDKQVSQLADLIELINGELTNLDRKKLITLCTIDVHARDVVQRLIDERVEDGSCFQWQSQLRYYQNEKTKTCQVIIEEFIHFFNILYLYKRSMLCLLSVLNKVNSELSKVI